MSNTFLRAGNQTAAVVCLLVWLSAVGCDRPSPEFPYSRSWPDRDPRDVEALDVDSLAESPPTADRSTESTTTPPSPETAPRPDSAVDPAAFFSGEADWAPGGFPFRQFKVDPATFFSDDWDSRNPYLKSKFPVWRDLLAGVAESEDDGERGWIHDARLPTESGDKRRRRWRYPALEDMLNQASEEGVDPTSFLLAALASKNPDVVTNAAIALSRSGNSSGMAQLVQAVNDSKRSRPMRCAAAEALASLPTPLPVPDLRELEARHGPPTPDRPAPYFADLHAALLGGLAGHVDPVAEPCFLLVLDTPFPLALRSQIATVKIDALDAFTNVPAGRLPEPVRRAVVRSLNDGDPRVRIAALEVIGQAEYPGAYPLLSRTLHDARADVRTAALAGLGRLGGAQSADTLEETLHHTDAAMREAAVLALATMGREALVLGAAEDESSRVRQAVAQAVRQFRTPEATAVALAMLDDRSSHVQREIVAAVRAWPLRMAGPILLKAIGKSAPLVRYEAHAQLMAANWAAAADFDPNAPAGQRADDVERLANLFREQIGFAPMPNAADERPPLSSRVSAEQLALVEPLLWRLLSPDTPQFVRRLAMAELIELGPGLVDALELIAVERRQALPEAVYREVLPRIQTEFDMLDRLTSRDVALRRRVASSLENLASDGPLRDLALARLAEVVVYETDPLVWQSVLRGIASDSREPAVRLAYAATGNAAEEVRRLACLHLTTHPAPDHVSVLAPLLTDAKTVVACQAARALGLSGSPAAADPLYEQLSRPNEPLRVELALALARLGDRRGVEQMELLSYSDDEAIARSVANSMGEIADPSFVPLLIRMLDGRQSVRIAALESLPKVVGRDVAKSSDGRIRDFAERREAWKRWYERERGGELIGMK